VSNESGNSYSAAWGDMDNDGDLDLFLTHYDSNLNALYQNNGDESFTKITTGPVASDTGKSLGVTWADIDNDNDLDIFVANKGDDQQDFLYRNTGGGVFEKVTAGVVTADAMHSRGGAWGDYDNDGDFDLFITVGNGANRLYRNNGGGTFETVTAGAIVTDTADSYGACWFDYDNDGHLDLFVSNGAEDSRLYRNQGDGSFAKLSSGVLVTDGYLSRGAAASDVDGDGDLDLLVLNGDLKKDYIYRNNTSDNPVNHWLSVRCKGHDATSIGALVRVKAVIGGATVW
ncbi:MAG: VCBS repeat-containing protein, partial [Deltaproteobacteria bacterium]|nr:VCBS repeat-containing protein [Deltaproteobacteria bacterium]